MTKEKNRKLTQQEEFDNSVKIVRSVLNNRNRFDKDRGQFNKAVSFILADKTIKIPSADSDVFSKILSNISYLSAENYAAINKALNNIEQLKKDPQQLRNTGKSIRDFVQSGIGESVIDVAEKRAEYSEQKASELGNNLSSVETASQVEDKETEEKSKTAKALSGLGAAGSLGGTALIIAGAIGSFNIYAFVFGLIFTIAGISSLGYAATIGKSEVGKKKEETILTGLDQAKDDMIITHKKKDKELGVSGVATHSFQDNILNERTDRQTLLNDKVRVAELITLGDNNGTEKERKERKEIAENILRIGGQKRFSDHTASFMKIKQAINEDKSPDLKDLKEEIDNLTKTIER